MAGIAVGGIGAVIEGLGGMDGDAIYKNFHDGPGSEGLGTSASKLKPLVDKYDAISQRLKKVAVDLESSWTGEASGAAQRGLAPLAEEFAEAAPDVHKAQDLIDKQSGLFSATKNAVKPVPPKPDKPDPMAMFLGAGESVDYLSGVKAHNDAAEHNRNQMDLYEGYSGYNTDNLPQSYGKLLKSEAGIDVDHGGDDGGGGTGHGPGGSSHGWTPPPEHGPGGDPNPGSGGGGTGGGGSTGPSGVSPPPGTANGPTPTGTAGAQAPGTTTPGFGGGGANHMPAAGPGGEQRGPGGFGPIGGTGGYSAGGGNGGSGSGSGRYGGGNRAGAGGGKGGAGEGAEGGSKSGVGRNRAGGASAAEEAAGRAPNRTGGRGMGAMPRGGGSKGGEDEEHERPSWLVEPDPDDFWFGGMKPVAPPVIE